MACTPVEFPNVDRARWERIKASVESKIGLSLPADSGEAGMDKVKVRWEYDEARAVLIVQCTKKPWLYPEGAVNDRIREEFGRLA